MPLSPTKWDFYMHFLMHILKKGAFAGRFPSYLDQYMYMSQLSEQIAEKKDEAITRLSIARLFYMVVKHFKAEEYVIDNPAKKKTGYSKHYRKYYHPFLIYINYSFSGG